MFDWVNSGKAAAIHIRLVSYDLFRVTGGAMDDINGQKLLVLGQNFFSGHRPEKPANIPDGFAVLTS
jgi:hypothetical protein